MNSLEDNQISFETALEQLESIVQQLENGDVALEKAIELYQDGMKLAGLCNRKLEQVEKKIEIITEEDGQLKKQSFSTPADEHGDII